MKNKIFRLLQELSGKEKVCEEDSLQFDLTLDSLGLVTLLIQIEEKFDVRLKESDMDPFALTSVSDVIRLVEKYIGDKDG